MEITDRQKTILEKIIDEYIATASPVSSQALEKRHNFGIKPAMIRIEMERLTDEGFLSQPFVSAGRVPTDKGYRFFVDKVLEEHIPEFRGIEKMEETLGEERDDIFGFTTKLAKWLAEASSSMAVLNLVEDNLSLKEGWEEILRLPEFSDRELFFDFADFVNDLEDKIDELHWDNGIKVYIGKESPMTKEHDFSSISTRCHFPGKKEGIISLVGPKRMEYEKNISLMQSLLELMENF